MTSLNGAAAIAAMRAMGTNIPGTCLNTVWQAYGSQPSTGPHAGQYPAAIDGWNYATDKHPGDMNPPAGVPVYFGVSPTRRDSDAGAGDVVISLGDGNVIATDANGRAGVIGVTTIAARAAIIQRPYLGWTGDFLGYQVAYGQIINNIASQKRDDTMVIVSSPNLGQVCITDSAGAFAIDNNVAGVLRQAHAAHDFANDTDVQTEIREAWTRANFVGDALEQRVRDTIAAITLSTK